MKQIVICLYKPNPNQETALEALMAEHLPTLQAAGYATPAPAYYAKSSDGTYLEIFEWVSSEAPGQAHADKNVSAIWNKIGAIAEIRALKDLSEINKPFSHFSKVEINSRQAVAQNMDDVMIGAKNFDVLVSFYKDFGNMSVVDASESYCTLRDRFSGSILCITNGPSVNSTAPGFRASNLSGSLQTLEKRGGKIVKQWTYGTMSGANAQDPEGNEIMIWQGK